MALRAVPDHPKFADLKHRLGLSKGATLGYLECVWHFAGRFTPQGNIGKYSDAQIEAWVEWDGAPGALMSGLADSRWIDRDPKFRLIIHDWPENSDELVHTTLARQCITFADGTFPKAGRLNQKEREKFKEWSDLLKSNPTVRQVADKISQESACLTESAACLPEVSANPPDKSANVPKPVPEPVPVPEPEPEREQKKPALALVPIRTEFPADLEARIRALADAAPDQQDYLSGVQCATEAVKCAMDPERCLVSMEASIPLWYEAMRDGRARMKTLRFLVVDNDWMRRPREPTKPKQSTTFRTPREQAMYDEMMRD